MVKIPGIYSTTVHVFSAASTHTAKLAIYVNRADGSGEEKLCDAHSVQGKICQELNVSRWTVVSDTA